MIDRLMPLLLALAVAPGAIRQACCCAIGSCRTDVPACEAESDPPPCCQAEAAHPPCCQDDHPAESPLDPCRCPGCPAEASDETLATEPRSGGPEIDAPLDVVEYACWPAFELPSVTCVSADAAPLDRPPPDRQALLCVWTI